MTRASGLPARARARIASRNAPWVVVQRAALRTSSSIALARPLRDRGRPAAGVLPSCGTRPDGSRDDGVATPPPTVLRTRPTACPGGGRESRAPARSEEHTSELQSRQYLVCRL